MPPDVGDVAELAEELADDWLCLATVFAFEVAVLDDGDRRVDRPAHVVALRVDVDVEVDERLAGSEQGPSARRPRQERRRPEEEPGQERGGERRAQDSDL